MDYYVEIIYKGQPPVYHGPFSELRAMGECCIHEEDGAQCEIIDEVTYKEIQEEEFCKMWDC